MNKPAFFMHNVKCMIVSDCIIDGIYTYPRSENEKVISRDSFLNSEHSLQQFFCFYRNSCG